jgi:hypothetical protein
VTDEEAQRLLEQIRELDSLYGQADTSETDDEMSLLRKAALNRRHP